MSKILVSGIKPTGEAQLGNYYGAIKNWVDIQHDYTSFFPIVDLHAITIDIAPDVLRQNTYALVRDLLASGIDPKHSLLCLQSEVPQHAELAWIFNCLTPVSELERMTQYKDKSGLVDLKDIEQKLQDALGTVSGEVKKLKEETIESIAKRFTRQIFTLPRTVAHNIQELLSSEINPLEQLLETVDEYQNKLKNFKQQDKINAGLFDYPVLMAADILVYMGEVVPVGEDQLQHLELTRIIARKFNNKYGDFFPEPAAKITEAKRVMSLTNPEKKMSKSHDEQGCIALSDSPDVIRKKIKKAVTDTGVPSTDMAPGVRNLFDLLKYANSPDHERLLKEYHAGNLKYAELKEAVGEAIVAELSPIQERASQISDDDITTILTEGRDKARAVAQKTNLKAKELVGFLQN